MLTLIEYFGKEIDNAECFIDDDMKPMSDEITYIDFHFGTEENIDYDSFFKIVINWFIYGKINKSPHIDLQSNEKYINIYL